MKNTIEIQHDGKEYRFYRFDVDRAIETGVLKEIKTFNLSLTEDQLAVLQTIGGRVGGPPTGARGVFDQVYNKLLAFGPVKTDLNLETVHESRAIYFAK